MRKIIFFEGKLIRADQIDFIFCKGLSLYCVLRSGKEVLLGEYETKDVLSTGLDRLRYLLGELKGSWT